MQAEFTPRTNARKLAVGTSAAALAAALAMLPASAQGAVITPHPANQVVTPQAVEPAPAPAPAPSPAPTVGSAPSAVPSPATAPDPSADPKTGPPHVFGLERDVQPLPPATRQAEIDFRAAMVADPLRALLWKAFAEVFLERHGVPFPDAVSDPAGTTGGASQGGGQPSSGGGPGPDTDPAGASETPGDDDVRDIIDNFLDDSFWGGSSGGGGGGLPDPDQLLEAF